MMLTNNDSIATRENEMELLKRHDDQDETMTSASFITDLQQQTEELKAEHHELQLEMESELKLRKDIQVQLEKARRECKEVQERVRKGEEVAAQLRHRLLEIEATFNKKVEEKEGYVDDVIGMCDVSKRATTNQYYIDAETARTITEEQRWLRQQILYLVNQNERIYLPCFLFIVYPLLYYFLRLFFSDHIYFQKY